tara:strand:+ start:2448 stop:2609 length:162 start_codon:yes stop_codon:yes gene_type:complete
MHKLPEVYDKRIFDDGGRDKCFSRASSHFKQEPTISFIHLPLNELDGFKLVIL